MKVICLLISITAVIGPLTRSVLHVCINNEAQLPVKSKGRKDENYFKKSK